MDNHDKNRDDLLKQFINPAMAESAPEGFTAKVMKKVNTEPVNQLAISRKQKRNLIPVISSAVTILLVMAAFLMPSKVADSELFSFMKFLNNIKISLPRVDLTSLFKFDIPPVLVYIFIGMLVLTLLDRALYGFFHRQRNNR